jgi:type IV conjugative transfer system coupling protein TraD
MLNNLNGESPKTEMKNNEFKDFTRGGQITLHNIRMYLQIIDKVLWIVIFVFIVMFVLSFYVLTTPYQRYVSGEYSWSVLALVINPEASDKFIQPSGILTLVKCRDIVNSPLVKQVVNDAYYRLIAATLFSLVVSILSYLCTSRWLKSRGKKHTDDIAIRGDSFVTKEAMCNLLVRRQINSDLILAGLPLVKNKETAHLFFHGTTGTGKSNAIKELLDQIRMRGDRAIIYDKSCNYLEEYYRPQHDVLLNPLDQRGESWDLWKECRDAADFDSFAAAQIPMPLSNQDPFWINAARTIFSVAAFEMRNDKDRSIAKLLQTLLTADLQDIQKYLKGTEAETLTSDKIEKTAVSIKSVLATYLKSLKYVKDDGKAFSIRQWVQDDSATNWLFITSLGDRHETLKPLISSWLDIGVNALLSLPTSQTRRIWLILDELTSLQPLPYLTQTLSESRKFGGCAVIGIQNYAQLSKLYGQDGAREISALLNTRFMFRQPDPDTAKWAAINFGESITDEVREGISYGANTMRDGISINRVETQKQLVSYSEIMSLADLQAFVRLPGQLPLTRLQFQYQPRQRLNEAFLLRELEVKKMTSAQSGDLDSSKEIDELHIKPKRSKKSTLKITTPLIKHSHVLDI